MAARRMAQRAASATILLSTLGCIFPPITPDNPVYRDHPAYQGDGEFRDITGFIGPFLVTGYEIRMPDFAMGEPLEAEYHLSSLRDIDKRCHVYLAIPGDVANQIRDTKHFDGHLRLTVVDSQDHTLMEAAGRLGDFVWSHGSECELYRLDHSHFEPDPQEHYRLRIEFSPDQELNCLRGQVVVRCGGFL